MNAHRSKTHRTAHAAIVILGLFMICLVANRAFALVSYASHLQPHQQPAILGASLAAFSGDALKQWPSEILRVVWQVAALSVLLFIGTPGPRSGSGPSA